MDSDHKKPEDAVAPSRRRFVSTVATGIAASAAVAPAMAQQSGSPDMANQPPPGRAREAAKRYPAPPFPNQSQPWPGLASKMTPRPDHGETTYRGSGRLAGRKALVTGGDSGIGRAAVIAFAREGADVAINYLPAEEADAKEVVELIRQAGRKAVAIPGDIRDEAFCRKLIDEAVRQLGGLDLLVNNASRQKSNDSILDLSTADFDWTFKTNVYAMFWITKAAVPHMKAGSCIINTASQQAFDPSENLVDYSMTKAAEVALTKSLAKQLAPKGIRVNAVAPGPVWTPLQVSGGQTQENLKKFGGDTPMKRPGQPAELALAYVTLAADESSFTTGHVYGVAGGNGQ
jgi:NAD(P)-dependent dehydrogenase (short-subunit alcohol dehydrogenase family)